MIRRGPKLSSIETVKFEFGKVIGDEAGIMWKSVDAKEWYRAMKQKIFRHAFVSPFEAMGMLMAVSGEKRAEVPHQTRNDWGEKDVRHAQHNDGCGDWANRVSDEEERKG